MRRMNETMQRVAVVGDVNPLDYGGGVVFGPDASGRFVLEYTEGLELPDAMRTQSGRRSPRTVIMYRFGWEATASFWKTFGRATLEKAEAIASTHGLSAEHFVERWESGDVHEQAQVIADVAAYWGWWELANEEYVDAGDLAKRWGVRAPADLPPRVGARVRVDTETDEFGHVVGVGDVLGVDTFHGDATVAVDGVGHVLVPLVDLEVLEGPE